jgi:cytoskeletal protein CcmA (bactofilin family)
MSRLSRVPTLLAAVTLVATLGCMPGDTENAPWETEVFLRPGGDIFAAGGELRVVDSVPGDVMLVGGSTEFGGHAEGSYLSAARDVRVDGVIEGSARAAGRDVVIAAQVGRNVTAAGATVSIADDARVDGNVYLAAREVFLRGAIEGHAYVGGDIVVIDGEVGGDLRVEAGSLTVGPDARIDGELRYRVDQDTPATIDPSARVERTRELEPRPEEGPNIGFLAARLAAFLLAGLVVVAMAPATIGTTVEAARANPVAALGTGLLLFLLTPLVIVIVAATLVGGPLALIVLMLYLVSLYLAPVIPALWIGGSILSDRRLADRRDAPTAFLVGGAIVAIAILLPWIGFLARALATWIGLGAVALVIRDRGRTARAAETP